MSIKKTKLLIAELRVISDSVNNEHCRKILLEAADRLEETDKIAEFYQGEASRLASKIRRKEKCKNMYPKK